MAKIPSSDSSNAHQSFGHLELHLHDSAVENDANTSSTIPSNKLNLRPRLPKRLDIVGSTSRVEVLSQNIPIHDFSLVDNQYTLQTNALAYKVHQIQQDILSLLSQKTSIRIHLCPPDLLHSTFCSQFVTAREGSSCYLEDLLISLLQRLEAEKEHSPELFQFLLSCSLCTLDSPTSLKDILGETQSPVRTQEIHSIRGRKNAVSKFSIWNANDALDLIDSIRRNFPGKLTDSPVHLDISLTLLFPKEEPVTCFHQVVILPYILGLDPRSEIRERRDKDWDERTEKTEEKSDFECHMKVAERNRIWSYYTCELLRRAANTRIGVSHIERKSSALSSLILPSLVEAQEKHFCMHLNRRVLSSQVLPLRQIVSFVRSIAASKIYPSPMSHQQRSQCFTSPHRDISGGALSLFTSPMESQKRNHPESASNLKIQCIGLARMVEMSRNERDGYKKILQMLLSHTPFEAKLLDQCQEIASAHQIPRLNTPSTDIAPESAIIPTESSTTMRSCSAGESSSKTLSQMEFISDLSRRISELERENEQERSKRIQFESAYNKLAGIITGIKESDDQKSNELLKIDGLAALSSSSKMELVKENVRLERENRSLVSRLEVKKTKLAAIENQLNEREKKTETNEISNKLNERQVKILSTKMEELGEEYLALSAKAETVASERDTLRATCELLRLGANDLRATMERKCMELEDMRSKQVLMSPFYGVSSVGTSAPVNQSVLFSPSLVESKLNKRDSPQNSSIFETVASKLSASKFEKIGQKKKNKSSLHKNFYTEAFEKGSVSSHKPIRHFHNQDNSAPVSPVLSRNLLTSTTIAECELLEQTMKQFYPMESPAIMEDGSQKIVFYNLFSNDSEVSDREGGSDEDEDDFLFYPGSSKGSNTPSLSSASINPAKRGAPEIQKKNSVLKQNKVLGQPPRKKCLQEQ